MGQDLVDGVPEDKALEEGGDIQRAQAPRWRLDGREL
jgi:hypothetical protein